MRVFIVLSLVAGAFAFLDCPDNQHYESCGTACPLTCDNYNDPPTFCVRLCIPGCHCDKGYVKTEDGECVKPESCPSKTFSANLCELPSETGMCRGYFPRYHFNKASGQCEKFIYGGCGGNENNFKTLEECHNTCAAAASNEICGENEIYATCGTACPLTCDNMNNPPKICTLQCVIGCQCDRGFFRNSQGKCVSPEQCPSKAFRASLCELPSETGMCKGSFIRFYYNKAIGHCELFYYGGCGGNENNFRNLEECHNTCAAASNGIGAPKNALCEQEKATGPCWALFHKYFYNKLTGQCEPFIYGGCQGNSNNFDSKADCEATCVA